MQKLWHKGTMLSQTQNSLAEWSKSLAPGASPQGRGFEPHSCHSLRATRQHEAKSVGTKNCNAATGKTVWPTGLRRWLKAPVRKGVGSNPTAVTWVLGRTIKKKKKNDKYCVLVRFFVGNKKNDRISNAACNLRQIRKAYVHARMHARISRV